MASMQAVGACFRLMNWSCTFLIRPQNVGSLLCITKMNNIGDRKRAMEHTMSPAEVPLRCGV